MDTQNDQASMHHSPSGGEEGRMLGESRPRNQTLLVIEDDPTFARIVGDRAATQGFKPIVANRGDVGLAMARQLRPGAIVLDVRLPGLDGWSLLDQFKHDASTRHIPVVFVSGDDHRRRALRRGAFDYLLKPVGVDALDAAIARLRAFAERPFRRLLIVEPDEARRGEILALVDDGDVRTVTVVSGEEAWVALGAGSFDGVVVAQTLPDTTAEALITRIEREDRLRDLSIILRTEGPTSARAASQRWNDVGVVREVASNDDLLEATALFLHRVEGDLAEPKRRRLERLRRFDPVLAGKKVLIVDDDTRNIFALKSLLEAQRMSVSTALDGKQSLDVLRREPPFDVVLMDVMMPEMDGYAAIRAIREVDAWRLLPIFALTAKAMKGDRERCIEAGASDYIAKPVDTAQLLSLLRVWLGP